MQSPRCGDAFLPTKNPFQAISLARWSSKGTAHLLTNISSQPRGLKTLRSCKSKVKNPSARAGGVSQTWQRALLGGDTPSSACLHQARQVWPQSMQPSGGRRHRAASIFGLFGAEAQEQRMILCGYGISQGWGLQDLWGPSHLCPAPDLRRGSFRRWGSWFSLPCYSAYA